MALDSNGHWDGSGVAPNEWFLVLTRHPQFMNHHRVSDVLTQEQAAKLEHHVRVNWYGAEQSREPTLGGSFSEYPDIFFSSNVIFCEYDLIAKGATAFEAYTFLLLFERDLFQNPSREFVADIVFEACHRIFDTCVLWDHSSEPAQDLFDRYEEVFSAIDLLPEPPVGIRLGAEKVSS